MYKAV